MILIAFTSIKAGWITGWAGLGLDEVSKLAGKGDLYIRGNLPCAEPGESSRGAY